MKRESFRNNLHNDISPFNTPRKANENIGYARINPRLQDSNQYPRSDVDESNIPHMPRSPYSNKTRPSSGSRVNRLKTAVALSKEEEHDHALYLNVAREDLVMLVGELKKKLNDTDLVITKLKSDNQRWERDFLQQQRRIEKIYAPTGPSLSFAAQRAELEKGVLVRNLKKHIQSLRAEILLKDREIEELKMSVGGARLLELNVENEEYLNEINRLKDIFRRGDMLTNPQVDEPTTTAGKTIGGVEAMSIGVEGTIALPPRTNDNKSVWGILAGLAAGANAAEASKSSGDVPVTEIPMGAKKKALGLLPEPPPPSHRSGDDVEETMVQNPVREVTRPLSGKKARRPKLTRKVVKPTRMRMAKNRLHSNGAQYVTVVEYEGATEHFQYSNQRSENETAAFTTDGPPLFFRCDDIGDGDSTSVPQFPNPSDEPSSHPQNDGLEESGGVAFNGQAYTADELAVNFDVVYKPDEEWLPVEEDEHVYEPKLEAIVIDSRYQKGDIVEGLFRGGDMWYKARVKSVYLGVDIAVGGESRVPLYALTYNDGDEERDVPERFVRTILSPVSSPGPEVAATSFIPRRVSEATIALDSYNPDVDYTMEDFIDAHASPHKEVDIIGEKKEQKEAIIDLNLESKTEDRYSVASPPKDAVYPDSLSFAPQAFSLGDEVEARFRSGEDWFDASIVAVNSDNTYNLLYDDGDSEKAVKPAFIRRLTVKDDSEHRSFTRGDSGLNSAAGLDRLLFDDASMSIHSGNMSARVASVGGGGGSVAGLGEQDSGDEQFLRTLKNISAPKSQVTGHTHGVLAEMKVAAEVSVGMSGVGPSIHTPAELKPLYEIGQAVEAQYYEGAEWHRAVIEAVTIDQDNRRVLYDVNYDDGDAEAAVKEKSIRCIVMTANPNSFKPSAAEYEEDFEV